MPPGNRKGVKAVEAGGAGGPTQHMGGHELYALKNGDNGRFV